jgi:Uma2 family endonuclease
MSEPLLVEQYYVTPEQYLAAERISEVKHEYRAGIVRAMAGATWAHNVIAANILADLVLQLRGKKCRAFGSDRRLRIVRAQPSFYYYPDVMVDCSESRELETESPTVIFEVLSPESETSDRGDKLVNYLAIPSMRVYVLVDQFRHTLTVFRRAEGDAWPMELLTELSDMLALPEIGCSLSMATIYADVFAQ